MASTIKVNNIQNQCGANIINESANTITIGASGDTISLAAGASQTGFGRTGTVDWDTTAKTASFTAVSGNGYFVNTTSGAITVTLPAGSAGDIVGISDYASTFQTNAGTITPNGTDKINGVNENAILSTQGIAVSLVYVDSTRGWKSVTGSDSNTTGNAFIVATGGTITTCGNCKIHTFTGPGTFCVSIAAVCAANNVVSYMVVAGGGAGGSDNASTAGGGGGAGGFREDKSPVTPYTASPLDGAGPITVTASPYPITVGAGGSVSPTTSPTLVGCGSNSVFSTITSAGGGAGATNSPNIPNPTQSGGNGGSGGGAPFYYGAGNGSGNTPPTTPSQGNNGGTAGGGSPAYGSGGGGGSSAVGGTGGTVSGGPGGNGVTTSISGTSTAYAGGGGGGFWTSCGAPACAAGSGGTGGGGSAGTPLSRTGNAATANTGGGGGAASGASGLATLGGAGGSGIVIIRYKYQ